MVAVYVPVDWAQRLADASPIAVAWYVAYVMKYGENVESAMHPSVTTSSAIATYSA